MPHKLNSIDQVDLLKEGDTVYRFPSKGAPENNFAAQRKADIDTYKIRSINRNNGTVRLVVADETLEVFTWPEDMERLDVKKSRILSEQVWWTL